MRADFQAEWPHNMQNNKTYRACDFCRYRKRKCVTSVKNAPRCDNCADIDVPCRRSLRRRSEKLRQKSQKLAAVIFADGSKAGDAELMAMGDAASTAVQQPASDILQPKIEQTNIPTMVPTTTTEITDLSAGSLVMAESRPSSSLMIPDHKRLTLTRKPPASVSSSSVSSGSFDSHDHLEYHHKTIRKFTAFLTDRRLTKPESYRLVQIAYELFDNGQETCKDPLLQGYFDETDFILREKMGEDEEIAATALLVLNRVPLAPQIIRKVYHVLKADYHTITQLPIPVAAGVIISNAWYSYLGIVSCDMGLPKTQLEILSKFNSTLEEDSFNRQYVILTQLLIRMQGILKMGLETRSYFWLKLEYDFLMVPLHVPHHLLDLRDDIPGTPYGRILHILVNTINFDFYLQVLKNPVLQEHMQLKPVPAVFHFMLAMASTVFRYGREILDKWHILSNCQAKMAVMCIELLRMSEMENCKEVLSHWRDDYDEFSQLRRQAQKIIGVPPWITEKHFGYSVFWTFRDMRSLHVEGMLPSTDSHLDFM